MRFGMIHRNTYVNSPTVLRDTWQTRSRDDLFFAGQMSGVEGYVESAASGLMAGQERRQPRARRAAVGAAAHDGARRAGLLRLARRSETLRAVEHRVRADAAAGPAGRDGSRTANRRFRSERSKDLAGMVREHLNAFLEHLRLNENASVHTVRAYESDLSQYLAFFPSICIGVRRTSTPADLTHVNARAFLGRLHKRGNTKASAARKLSAIRAFGRYLRREGVLEADPAALVGAPKREAAHPGAPRRRRDVEAARDAGTSACPSAGAIGRSWSCFTPPACG